MLVLHIGRGKAGSSTIQRGLLTSRTLLRTHGILMPPEEELPGGNFAALPAALRSDDAASLRAFLDFVEQSHPQRVVVSSEFLFSLRAPQIASLRELIKGHQVLIVAYVRDYTSWLPSLYAQATRTGKNRKDFDDFFERTRARCSVVPNLQAWADVFGWEKLRVRSIDSASLEGGDIMKDFSSVLGVEMVLPADRNVSPHWVEIEFIRAVYSRAPLLRKDAAAKADLRRARDRLKKCIAAESLGSARYLTKHQLEDLAAEYAKDLEYVGKRTGVAIPMPVGKQGRARDFLPSLETAPRSVMRRFFDAKYAPSFWQGRHPELLKILAAIGAELGVDLPPPTAPAPLSGLEHFDT
jgi:hypothetical protein